MRLVMRYCTNMRSLFFLPFLATSLVVAQPPDLKPDSVPVSPPAEKKETPPQSGQNQSPPVNKEKTPEQEQSKKEGEKKETYVIPDGKSIPKAEKMDDSRIKLGKVVVNHKEKSITIPAVANMKEGLIEYLLSMPHGKLHESMFVTEADPLHVSVAAKLLKLGVVKGLFPERDDNMEWLPYNPPKRDKYKNALVDITISWKKDGKTITKPISQLINFKSGPQKLSTNEWAIVDSSFYRNCYQASVIGDIIAIFGDPNSFITYTGFANDGENVWLADPKTAPEPGTKVEITIKQLPLAEADKPLSVRPATPGTSQEKQEVLEF